MVMKRIIRANTQPVQASNKLFETTMGGLNYISALAKMLRDDLDKAIPTMQRAINEGELDESDLEDKLEDIENIHEQLTQIYDKLNQMIVTHIPKK